MGTNYYLTPKGFDKVSEINKTTLKVLNEIRDNYCKSIKELIDEASKNHKIYKEVLDIQDIDNIDCRLIYDFEIPEIHICKLSFGWCPSFESTEYYSNFNEFKEFYNKYKDDFDITDEYNRYLTIDELESLATTAKENAKEFHSKFNSCGVAYYTTDNYGFEWTNTHFS